MLLYFAIRLHDGGFTDPTDDNEPAPPAWHSWMKGTEEYKINIDMKYSGNFILLLFFETVRSRAARRISFILQILKFLQLIILETQN